MESRWLVVVELGGGRLGSEGIEQKGKRLMVIAGGMGVIRGISGNVKKYDKD